MSGVAIVTDTSALFAEGVAESLGVIRVPVAVALDGQAYGSDDVEDFYERMSRGARATTSQPSPGDLLQAYGAAAARGAKEVLSIHLDSRLSGTVASAELATADAAIPVSVVDTQTVSFGVGVCVQAAAGAVGAGASAQEAAEVAREIGLELRNVFVAPGGTAGRAGGEDGWAALELAEGSALVIGECKTVGDAVRLMAKQVLATQESVRVAVGHAAAMVESAADELAAALLGSVHVMAVERYRVGPAVGAHSGPRSFGAFWWPAE